MSSNTAGRSTSTSGRLNEAGPAAASESGKTATLEMFTDEELTILAGPGGIVVAPFWDRIGADQRTTARRTAFRSLLARGILDPPTAEAMAAAERKAAEHDPGGADRTEETGLAVDLAVRQDVHAMVTLRGAARGVVAAARTTSTGKDFWYAHIVDDVALIEQVDADGLHRFALLDAPDLPAAVIDAAVHPDTGDADGEPVEVPASEEPTEPHPIMERLGSAFLRCELVIRTVGDDAPVLLGTFTGPGGAWLFRNVHGSESPVVARPQTAAGIRGELDRRTARMLADLADGHEPRSTQGSGT